jgi:hypothetical protein
MLLLTRVSSHTIRMGSNCTRCMMKNLRDELWSYFALSGLLFLNMGIVLVVYALKRATPHPTVVKLFGIGLITMGILATLASWYVHRQHRQRKPVCSCAFGCLRMTNPAPEASENGFMDCQTSFPSRESGGGGVSPTEAIVRKLSAIEFQVNRSCMPYSF